MARAGELTSWLVEQIKGGHTQALSIRLFDVHDDAGQTIGRGLLMRDVTREREADRFKTTLLGAVGHELRTPLAAIKGYASTLLQDDVTWPIDDQRSFLRTISSEADRLAQLVSNLLDLSRLDAGLLSLQRAPCRLEDVVASAVRRLHAPISDLDVQLPAGLPALDVDGARIEVVLHNLLSNALAYGNGHVSVDAGMTTEPTISRLVQSGLAKVLVDLRTPASTRAAMGGDLPFICLFMRADYVSSHKDVVQKIVNAYVKTMKWIHTHSAAQIATKMPADYYAGNKALYITALKGQLGMFSPDGTIASDGPASVLKVENTFNTSVQGKHIDLSKTWDGTFVAKANM